MIGHRTARHECFGWAAARLDDLVNLIPARLSGLLLAVVAPIANGAVGTAAEGDAARCAKASLAQCRLAGKRTAGALGLAWRDRRPRRTCRRRSLSQRRRAQEGDTGRYRRALDLYVAACLLQAAVYAALALVA